MYIFNSTSAFRIDQPSNTYVFDIVPLSGYVAAISSDDCLRLVDPLSLSGAPITLIEHVHSGITCLKALDLQSPIVCTAGRDGRVSFYDFRAKTKIAELKTDQGAPILSLTTCSPTYAVAAGTELIDSQASAVVWDARNLRNPIVQYIESHSDDITELQYHPTRHSILLSGSTDGLVNLYDTNIADEDDALYQTINHDSSIHRTGFLNDRDIFALSHDEKFSVYHLVTDLDETVEEPSPVHFGDVRQTLGCEYVSNIIARSGGGVIGIGSHSRENFELMHLNHNVSWQFMEDSKVVLLGAHGTEIVRSFCVLDEHKTVMTSGEDGLIKAWQSSL